MAHKVLEFAHSIVCRTVRNGENAVDATAGNGHDTVRLARLVGATGRVWSMDVQAEALNRTARLLRDENLQARVTLVRSSHASLRQFVTPGIAAAMFNLGYLPGGDRTLVTRTEPTIAGLNEAWDMLRPGGVVSVVVYRGHPGGSGEAEAVLRWAGSLAACHPVRFGFSTADGAPPEAIIVAKPGSRATVRPG